MFLVMGTIFCIALWRGKTWFGPRKSADRFEDPVMFWLGQVIVAIFGLVALAGVAGVLIENSN